jgi:8-oxo-dGTP pyrophosphatase MutT (NUDIX family)
LSTKSKGKTKYYIPGGKRESGESDEQTLIREIAEELSVTIIPNTAEYIGTFSAQSDGEKEGINVIMTCYKAKYSLALK